MMFAVAAVILSTMASSAAGVLVGSCSTESVNTTVDLDFELCCTEVHNITSYLVDGATIRSQDLATCLYPAVVGNVIVSASNVTLEGLVIDSVTVNGASNLRLNWNVFRMQDASLTQTGTSSGLVLNGNEFRGGDIEFESITDATIVYNMFWHASVVVSNSSNLVFADNVFAGNEFQSSTSFSALVADTAHFLRNDFLGRVQVTGADVEESSVVFNGNNIVGSASFSTFLLATINSNRLYSSNFVPVDGNDYGISARSIANVAIAANWVGGFRDEAIRTGDSDPFALIVIQANHGEMSDQFIFADAAIEARVERNTAININDEAIEVFAEKTVVVKNDIVFASVGISIFPEDEQIDLEVGRNNVFYAINSAYDLEGHGLSHGRIYNNHALMGMDDGLDVSSDGQLASNLFISSNVALFNVETGLDLDVVDSVISYNVADLNGCDLEVDELENPLFDFPTNFYYPCP